jgi:hypothetical protein
MKTRFLASILVLGACADGASVEAPSSVAVPDRSHPAPEASHPPPAPPPIYDELQGTVMTDLGEPIVGRPIVVVDARGRRTDTESLEGGEFRVPDVATPYDLAIAPAPVGDVVVPTVLFGVSRIDPTIELFERNGPVGRPPSQRFPTMRGEELRRDRAQRVAERLRDRVGDVCRCPDADSDGARARVVRAFRAG